MSNDKLAIYFLGHYRQLKDQLIALDAHVVKATSEYSGMMDANNSLSSGEARTRVRRDIVNIHDTVLEASDVFPENKQKLKEEFIDEMNWHITPKNTYPENMTANMLPKPTPPKKGFSL